MGSAGEQRYAQLLHSLGLLRTTIDHLEATPSSPKRDASLTLLRDRMGALLVRLAEHTSDSHRN